MIGVIGGMGPLATADYLNKVIAQTPAEDDADHVPMLISDRLLLPAIAAVKAGRIAQSGPLALEVLRGLSRRGATHIVLACTELPIALAGMEASLPVVCIDTTLALAKATVAYWRTAQLIG